MKRISALVIGVVLGALAAVPVSLRAQLRAEAGFISLEESVSYYHAGSYFNRIPLKTSPARIWYIFRPADAEAESKPLFVFYNGGPGGATSCGLYAASTAPFAVIRDETTGDAALAANPASWTGIGNLLYIDSRTAGFSYSLMDDPGDASRRAAEFDAQNYNPYVDGADFVRVLLKFLAAHQAIRGNRVVLIPESYGGTRTIVMLNLLLYYGRYADGSAGYQDPGLVDAIQAHYDAVFPGHAGHTVPPAVIAGQFGHQILIQTSLTWAYQRRVAVRLLEKPGSILDKVAAETGIPYVRYADSPGAVPNPSPSRIMNHIWAWLDLVGRDPYHIAKPEGYFDGHRFAAENFLTHIDTLNLMTGIDVLGIPEMFASARGDAYKIKAVESRDAGLAVSRTVAGGTRQARPDFSALVGPPPTDQKWAAWLSAADGDGLPAVFGRLQPWDRFFIELNYDANAAFADNKLTLQSYDVAWTNSASFGRMFLENAAWVETFATNASWDAVVFAASLPEALSLHTDVLTRSRLDALGPPGAARPGRIVLSYQPSSIPGSTVRTRTIRFPAYLKSGHAVTMTESMEILEDVIDWLATTGLHVGGR